MSIHERVGKLECDVKEINRLVNLFNSGEFLERIEKSLDKVIGSGVEIVESKPKSTEKSTDEKITELMNG